jgi:hypothetical protein
MRASLHLKRHLSRKTLNISVESPRVYQIKGVHRGAMHSCSEQNAFGARSSLGVVSFYTPSFAILGGTRAIEMHSMGGCRYSQNPGHGLSLPRPSARQHMMLQHGHHHGSGKARVPGEL